MYIRKSSRLYKGKKSYTKYVLVGLSRPEGGAAAEDDSRSVMT